MMAAKRRKGRPRWQPATINRYLSYIRRVFSLAVKAGHLATNPASGGSLRAFPEAKRTRWLTDGELTRLEGVMVPEAWTVVLRWIVWKSSTLPTSFWTSSSRKLALFFFKLSQPT